MVQMVSALKKFNCIKQIHPWFHSFRFWKSKRNITISFFTGAEDADHAHPTHWLDELMESYSNNFTVHGLYKVLHGHFIERLFWGLATIVTFSLVTYFGSMYIARYLAYEHRTLVDYHEHQSIELPVITLYTYISQHFPMLQKSII